MFLRNSSHNLSISVTTLFLIISLAAPAKPTLAAPDLKEVSQKIRSEASERSQIMNYAFYLTDVYGPRLTGSPNFRAAGDWAIQELKTIGLTSLTKEPIQEFRYSWYNTRFSLAMTAPSFNPLIGAPYAWSTGTKGPVEGEAIRVDMPGQTVDGVTKFMEKYKGKLRGKVLLLMNSSNKALRSAPQSFRWSDGDVAEQVAKAESRAKSTNPSAASAPQTNGARQQIPTPDEVKRINDMFADFFAEERALAMIINLGNPKLNDGGTFPVERALLQDYETTRPGLPPTIAMAGEHYNRLVRLVNKGIPVRLRLDVGVKLIDKTPDAFNVIGEIPGTDKKDEIVLIGAHLDSWTGGTGATDNAAGCAVMMEVARILKALNLPLKRTVRLALWGGEELGNMGSRSYVNSHLVELKMDFEAQRYKPTGKPKPEYEKFSSYYNLDEGTGRIRGVIIGNDQAARSLIQQWLSPVNDLGAFAVLPRPGAGSDDASFTAAGLPSFSFLQDPLEYNTRTHHTNMDVYDRLQKDDLIQAATVIATLVYADANNEGLMPRPNSQP